MKKICVLCLAMVMALTVSGCGADTSSATASGGKKHVKIGCVEPTLSMVNAMLPMLREQGYEPEVVVIEGNVNLIRLTNDKGLDASLGVHMPFMEKFNQDNKGELVMVKPYAFYSGMGFFSDRYATVDAIPQSARIGIMNDAMNMDRGLKILQDAGLIKLDPAKKGSYTTLDVTENPKNLQFIDMDQIQTVRSLADLDGAIVFFTHMVNAGRDCSSYLVRDREAENYPSAFVVRKENENAPWALDLEKTLRTPEMQAFIAKSYPGVYTFYE